MPPDERVPVGFLAGCATAMYPPMYHMQREPATAPNMRRNRRPSLSMRKKSQNRVMMVLMTPKIPVVRSEVLVPVIPMDLRLNVRNSILSRKRPGHGD